MRNGSAQAQGGRQSSQQGCFVTARLLCTWNFEAVCGRQDHCAEEVVAFITAEQCICTGNDVQERYHVHTKI